MEKIDTFRITRLTVEGFKCFGEKQSFDFGALNFITGHNGQGKSSIGEAIAYAITGVPFYGEGSLDRLYTIGGKSVSVELTLETGDGATHTLTRGRVSDVTTITYDGVTIRQSDLYAMFGEKDVFLSIFNPLYFIEVLGDKGRNLLERYLPAIPHEAVLKGLSESSRKLLEEQKMKSPESLLESTRAGIRELEDTIIYIEGQRDLLESQARDANIAFLAKRGEIDTLDESILELEQQRAEGLDFVSMKEQLDDLYARYDEMSHEGTTPPDTSAVDAEIQGAMAKLEKRRAEEYVSKYAEQIAGTDATVKQLLERYHRENAILTGLAPGIECPTCKQAVTAQNLASVQKAFADSIAEVVEQGRGLSAQLKEITALDDSTKAVFENFRNEDVSKLESELAELRAQRTDIIAAAEKDAETRKTDMDTLKGQIQSLEVDLRFGNLSPDEGWRLEGLKEDRKKLESEIALLKEAQSIPAASSKDGDIKSLRNSITAKRELEDTVKAYISTRASKLLEGLGELNRIGIVLYEPVKKSGEVRDVFKFTFDGKPYKFLSLSEKIKAGLEVSELMKRLVSCNYPVFIDNGESVPVIDNVRPSGQVFIAQVAKGAPLQVEIAGANESQQAA